MLLRFGNLSPEELAGHVGAVFTDEEITYLRSVWSKHATLTGPDDWHAFDDPAVSIHVGSAESETVRVLQASNARATWTREVHVYVDEAWRTDEGGQER